jgi:hypothetical protein
MNPSLQNKIDQIVIARIKETIADNSRRITMLKGEARALERENFDLKRQIGPLCDYCGERTTEEDHMPWKCGECHVKLMEGKIPF